MANSFPSVHSHVFLGQDHEQNERRSWMVIWLCGAMMIAEIIGGLFFGSIALVADGLHMSTHAGALLLAALAYIRNQTTAICGSPAQKILQVCFPESKLSNSNKFLPKRKCANLSIIYVPLKRCSETGDLTRTPA